MDLKQIFDLILLLLGPLFSIALVKKGLEKAVTAVSGEIIKLGYMPKLIFGIGFTFAFIALLQAHGVTGLPNGQADRWAGVLLTALSKTIYDIVNDYLKNRKK